MDPVTAIANLVGQGLKFGGTFVERGNIDRARIPTLENYYLQNKRAEERQNKIIIFVIVGIIAALIAANVYKK